MVEEDGEIDAVITKEFVEQEKQKLEELKKVAAEKKQMASQIGAAKERKVEAKEARAEVKKQQKKVTDLTKKLREIEKKQRETDNKIKGFFSKLGQGIEDPKSFFEASLVDLLQSVRIIPLVASGTAFGLAIFKLVEREFGPGGAFDLRVLIHDFVRAVVGLKQLMDIDSGEVFMSADTRITTMPPETSNTESLRDGHVKFNQLTLGYR